MINLDFDQYSDLMQILELIEKGRITADDRLHLHQALNEAPPQRSTGVAREIPHPGPSLGVSTGLNVSEPFLHFGEGEAWPFYEDKPEVFPEKQQ